jgi:hypothetical protein
MEPEELSERLSRYEAACNSLDQAVLGALSEHATGPVAELAEEEHVFPTRYVLVAEWATLHGNTRHLQVHSLEGMEAWDVHGLLGAAQPW